MNLINKYLNMVFHMPDTRNDAVSGAAFQAFQQSSENALYATAASSYFTSGKCGSQEIMQDMELFESHLMAKREDITFKHLVSAYYHFYDAILKVHEDYLFPRRNEIISSLPSLLCRGSEIRDFKTILEKIYDGEKINYQNGLSYKAEMERICLDLRVQSQPPQDKYKGIPLDILSFLFACGLLRREDQFSKDGGVLKYELHYAVEEQTSLEAVSTVKIGISLHNMTYRFLINYGGCNGANKSVQHQKLEGDIQKKLKGDIQNLKNNIMNICETKVGEGEDEKSKKGGSEPFIEFLRTNPFEFEYPKTLLLLNEIMRAILAIEYTRSLVGSHDCSQAFFKGQSEASKQPEQERCSVFPCILQ